MCVLIFSTTLSDTFLVLTWIKRDIIQNVYRSACIVPVTLSDCNETWIFWTDFEKIKRSNIMKIRCGNRVVSCGRTNRQTDVTKLIVAFRSFEKRACNWIFEKVGWCQVDWIDLAEDRDTWRAVVNTVMNVREPQNVGSFFVSRGCFDFSVRTLLQGVILTFKSGHSIQTILPDDLDAECGLDAYSMTLSEKGNTSYQRIE